MASSTMLLTVVLVEDVVEDVGDDAASACDLSRSTNRGLPEWQHGSLLAVATPGV